MSARAYHTATRSIDDAIAEAMAHSMRPWRGRPRYLYLGTLGVL